MNAKQTIFIAVLWALFLAPAACLAGDLDHFCPCESAIECGHELDCSADPCNIVALLKTDNRAEDTLLTDISITHDLPGCSQLDAETLPGKDLLVIHILEFPALLVPDSALPLLC
jgi:hypothetical protein